VANGFGVRVIGNAARHEPPAAAAVIVELVSNAANQRELVGDHCVYRQKFANVNPWNIGRNRRELCAVVLGRVRLHVVGFQVRRPTNHTKTDLSGAAAIAPAAALRRITSDPGHFRRFLALLDPEV